VKCEGYIAEIDAMTCARVCGDLGGSRFKASDIIDPSVGIVITHHVGCHVSQGTTYTKASYSLNFAVFDIID